MCYDLSLYPLLISLKFFRLIDFNVYLMFQIYAHDILFRKNTWYQPYKMFLYEILYTVHEFYCPLKALDSCITCTIFHNSMSSSIDLEFRGLMIFRHFNQGWANDFKGREAMWDDLAEKWLINICSVELPKNTKFTSWKNKHQKHLPMDIGKIKSKLLYLLLVWTQPCPLLISNEWKPFFFYICVLNTWLFCDYHYSMCIYSAHRHYSALIEKPNEKYRVHPSEAAKRSVFCTGVKC